MKSTNWKTTLGGWLAAACLALSMPSSPVYALVPDSVHNIAAIGAMIATGMIGQKAQDKPESPKAPESK